MPTPNPGESRGDFIERCIPVVIEDGTAENDSQAFAVCQSLYDADKAEIGDLLLQACGIVPVEQLNEIANSGTVQDLAIAIALAKQGGFSPTDGMVQEAQRGLDWRNEFGRGGTEVGIARARDIVNQRNLSLNTVRRMNSFFARHEVDKEAEGFRPGEDGYPSNGRIAWALWGGDPGQTWAARIVAQHQEDKSMEEKQMVGPTNMRGFDVDTTFGIVQTMKRKFNKDESAFVELDTHGGEYACASCRFYLRDPGGMKVGTCEVVDGAIPCLAHCDLYIGSREAAVAEFEIYQQDLEHQEAIQEPEPYVLRPTTVIMGENGPERVVVPPTM